MKYKLFFLSISMFFIVLENKAQTEPYCVHYPYNTQVGINLNVNLLSKMNTEQSYRHENLFDYIRSYPSFGADLGVYLYQRIYKWFGIQIGAEYNALTFRFGYTKDFADIDKTYMKYYGGGAFTFPVLFNASYYFNEKHGMDISLGGATHCVIYPFTTHEINPYGKNRWERCLVKFEYSYYNFSLYGKIGYNFLFKNKNTLGMAIIGSYASNPYAKGFYFFTKYKEDDVGYISLYNTFVGLQFSYGFTMKELLCK